MRSPSEPPDHLHHAPHHQYVGPEIVDVIPAKTEILGAADDGRRRICAGSMSKWPEKCAEMRTSKVKRSQTFYIRATLVQLQAQLRRGAECSGRKLIRQTWTRTSGEPEWTYESPILCADAAGLPAVHSRWDQSVKLPTRHAETRTMQAATTPFRIVSTPLSNNYGVQTSTPLSALIAALGDVRSAHPTSTSALDELLTKV